MGGALRRMLTVGLIVACASLLPAMGSFLPQASGVFGGVANAACKWNGKPGPGALYNTFDHWYFKASVESNWCYDGQHVLSRQSNPGGQVTALGILDGWIYLNSHWAYSQCNTYNGIWNHNCLTKREFNLITLHTGDTQSICIETRIYGNGYHHRQITVEDFDGCHDGIQANFF
jgi:hypothetical protein